MSRRLQIALIALLSVGLVALLFASCHTAIRPLPIQSARSLSPLPIIWEWRAPEGTSIQACAFRVPLLVCTAVEQAHGSVFALSLTGTVLWKHQLEANQFFLGGPLPSGRVWVVAVRSQLLALEEQTGNRAWERSCPLGCAIISGEPLVVQIPAGESLGQTTELLVLDSTTGGDLAKVRTPGSLTKALTWERDILVSAEQEGQPHLVLLRGRDLALLWERSFPRTVNLIRGNAEFWVQVQSEGGKPGSWHVLNKSGQLQVVAAEPAAACDLRWASDGYTLWHSREGLSPWILCRSQAQGPAMEWCRWLPKGQWIAKPGPAHSLILAGTLPNGPVLVQVDQQGKLLSQARGFPGASIITAETDLWLFQGGHHVFATGLEPLPSSERTIRAVKTLLDRANSYPSCHWNNWQQVAEFTERLQNFGPNAAPVLLEQLPHLKPVAFVACAQVLGQWRTKAAAPALWLWLMERSPQCQVEGWGIDLIAPVFEALRKLRIDPWMVPSLAKLAADASVEPRVRIEAFTTLAHSQLPEAMAACHALLERSKPETSTWYKPESPEILVPFVPHDRPLDKEVVLEVEKLCERQDCPRPYFHVEVYKQLGARRLRWGNRELLLYFSPYLGGEGDLWLADTAPESKESPKFTGISVHGDELVPRAYDFRVEVTDDGFSVYRALEPGLKHKATSGAEVFSGSCKFSELNRDQDGDGLPDLVEKRLRLIPDQRDTDSDGLEDALDLCPNCGSDPETAEDHAAKGLLWQFYALFGPSELRPAVVVWPRKVEFFVPGRVAIVLTEEQSKRFRQEAGLSEDFDQIEINPPKERRQFDNEEWPQELRPGKNEIAFELVIYRHGLNAEGYGVLLRATDPNRYILVRCLPLWVS